MHYIILGVLMSITVGTVVLFPIEQKRCMVSLDTSRGKDTYQVDAYEVKALYEYESEDRSQSPTSCNWLYCNYPKYKGCALSFRDMSQVRVRNSKEEVRAKISQTCHKEL